MKKKIEEENAKQRAHHATQSGPSSDELKKRGTSALKSPVRDPNQRKPSTPQKSPAVSRNAKKKWEMLERKVSFAHILSAQKDC